MINKRLAIELLRNKWHRFGKNINDTFVLSEGSLFVYRKTSNLRFLATLYNHREFRQ